MTESKYELDRDPYTDESILPSAQIDKFYSFYDRNEKRLTCQTVFVDFNNLLYNRPQSSDSNLTNNNLNNHSSEPGKDDERIISTISNQDLFHAVVGLYDASLPDMTLDVIYETVCTKQAKTIIVLRNLEETLHEIEVKRKQSSIEQQCDSEDCKFIKDLMRPETEIESSAEETSSPTAGAQISDGDSCKGKQICNELLENLLDSDDEFFANVFNECDEEINEENKEEEEESEDFSAGLNTFKRGIILRKHMQKQHRYMQQQHIGVENRIIACATYSKVTVDSKDRIIQLTLMGVKKNWRKIGVGKYIVSKLTQPSVVGCYDAVVVHADYSAMEFFQHLGFSDDYLLNSRWSSICAQFTDCVLMTYIPAFTISGMPMSFKPDKEFDEMEDEFTLWKLKSLSAYQAQLTCLHRMKNEVFQLKSMVNLQHQLILKLFGENEQFSQQKDTIMSIKQIYADTANETTDEKTGILSRHECPDGNILTTVGNNTFITFRPSKVKKTSEPDYIHVVNSLTDVIRKFKIDMENDARHADYHITCAITGITKAFVADQRSQTHETSEAQAQLTRNSPSSQYSSRARHRMYFCSHQPIKTEKLQEILERGFTNEDFSIGDLGEGLHFCRSPFTAAHFSVPGKLLLAEVQLGRIKCDFQMPSEEEKCQWGSVLTAVPQNNSSSNIRSRSFLEEYLVLKAEQAVPLCLIEYVVSKSITDYKSLK